MTPLAARSLDQLDVFDHAFVDTVLHLRGIDEPPDLEDFQAALDELGSYYSALALAPAGGTALDDTWFDGQSIDQAAAQLAFLYCRFGLLYRSQATPLQLLAFQRWWATGDDTMGYASCPGCG
jgi:hypothetical protein